MEIVINTIWNTIRSYIDPQERGRIALEILRICRNNRIMRFTTNTQIVIDSKFIEEYLEDEDAPYQ